VTTQSFGLSASLLTGLRRIFAFTWAMTILLAEMRAALERLTARLAATSICEPARHVFHHLLATQAFLFGEEWTFWTAICIDMAVMSRLRMTARLRSATRE
jgi:hypothetical protein